MKPGRMGAIALSLSIFTYSGALAETVPHILANFPNTQDHNVRAAFSDRIRANFPVDIRTSTLTALLEMDGFTVSRIGNRHTARFVDVTFPCITDYSLTWGETDRGHVADIQVAKSRKCV